MTLDSVTRPKLFEFTNPKEPHQGLVQNSICMEHMTLLENMVRRRLKEKTEIKYYCCAHEFKHYGSLIKFPWNVKGTVKKGGVGVSWHTVHAFRHLG